MPVSSLNGSMNVFSTLEAEKLRLEKREGFTHTTCIFKMLVLCWQIWRVLSVLSSQEAIMHKAWTGLEDLPTEGKKGFRAKPSIAMPWGLHRKRNSPCLSLTTGLVSQNDTGFIRYILLNTWFPSVIQVTYWGGAQTWWMFLHINVFRSLNSLFLSDTEAKF